MALSILILTPRIPYPLRDGGSIAMNQSIEAYLDMGCEVSLLAMNTSRHWVDEATLPEYYQRLKHFKTVFVKTNISPLSAFLNLFTDKSYNVERFENKEFAKELNLLLKREKFSFIQFESIYTAPYLKFVKLHWTTPCYCRVHNIEYLIWQRLSEHESSFLKRKYLELLTSRLKIYELETLKQFNLLLPISNIEDHYFTSNNINACYYLPFGIDSKPILKDKPEDPLSCYHIGSMDWAPNIEGVHWFIEEVWPRVHQKLQKISLYLAGKNMPLTIQSKPEQNLEVVGEVDDVQTFSLEKNIMIVPLLSGAGIRIKIIEAMAMGKTIISTSVGIEGIGAIHNETILIANTPEEFCESIEFCFSEPMRAQEIGQRAKQFVQQTFLKTRIYANWVLELNRYL